MPNPLDPKLLAATRGLTLAARGLVAGLLPGLHASRQPGMAREFAQYRAYQPGDEPRHIDWKLYARSDRYFVRESEIETAINVRLILDATASMRHADAANPHVDEVRPSRAYPGGRSNDARGRRKATRSACMRSLAVVESFPRPARTTAGSRPNGILRTFWKICQAAGPWPADARRALHAAFAAGVASAAVAARTPRARSSSCSPT